MFDLASLNGKNGFSFTTSSAYSGAAGDIDGDGYNDIVVGLSVGRDSAAGSVTVLYGKADGFASSQSLSSLVGNGADRVLIGDAERYESYDAASAGDLNGDGRDDLIVSTFNGGGFVVFGQAGRFASPLKVSGLDGKNGFVLPDRSTAVASAGDLNGDGIGDVIAGSSVIFGKKGGFGARVEAGDLNGSNGFTLGLPGGYVNSAAVAGDGLDDLVVSVWGAEPDSEGNAYVVFGRKGGFDARVDLTKLDGSDGFRISGKGNYYNYFDEVRSAGDLNNDGFADLIIATGRHVAEYGPDDRNEDRPASAAIVFGHAGRFDATVGLSDLDGTNGFQIGGVEEHRVVSVDSADVNGDGAVDILIGNGTPTGSDVAGYVIYGNRAFAGVTLTGGSNVDTLRGTVNADRLNGAGGNDTLIGLGGDDLLDGGQGADRMEGGAGNDVYAVDHAGDRVIEATGEGRDTIVATVGYALAAGMAVETLQLASSTGKASLKLFGNELDNLLRGNNGANLLDGRAGADILQGKGGDDTYAVDNKDDRVVEAAGQGLDAIVTQVSYKLDAGQAVEILQLATSTGTARLDLVV